MCVVVMFIQAENAFICACISYQMIDMADHIYSHTTMRVSGLKDICTCSHNKVTSSISVSRKGKRSTEKARNEQANNDQCKQKRSQSHILNIFTPAIEVIQCECLWFVHKYCLDHSAINGEIG